MAVKIDGIDICRARIHMVIATVDLAVVASTSYHTV